MSAMYDLLDYVPYVGTAKNAGEAVVAAVDGDTDKAIGKGVSAVIGGALDAVTFGIASPIGNVIGKGVSKVTTQAATGVALNVVGRAMAKDIPDGLGGRPSEGLFTSGLPPGGSVYSHGGKGNSSGLPPGGSGYSGGGRSNSSRLPPGGNGYSGGGRSNLSGGHSGGGGGGGDDDKPKRDSETKRSPCEIDEKDYKKKQEELRKARAGTCESNRQGNTVQNGPSGKNMIHCIQFNSKKEARDAAKKDSQEYAKSAKHEPLDHPAHGTQKLKNNTLSGKKKDDFFNKNKKGDHSRHFHAVDKEGKKLENGIHYLYP